jgi:hypothetical protein
MNAKDREGAGGPIGTGTPNLTAERSVACLGVIVNGRLRFQVDSFPKKFVDSSEHLYDT